MTNAWIQRLLTLGLMALSGGIVWQQWPQHSVWAIAWTLIPLAVLMALEAVQFVFLYIVNRSDRTPRATAVQHLQAWWGEMCSSAVVFNWWQPFRRNALADHLPAVTANAIATNASLPGIVLVHGFFCNRGFWTHWMRRLRSEGRVFSAVDLEPAFGSIDEYITTIDRAVQQVRDATGMPPIIVGHSMGGLAIRAWMATQNQPDLAVRRVITLGTPHHGTWISVFSHSVNGAQMQLDSPWLKSLAAQENAGHAAKYVCFYSNCDNIVFPVSTATLEGADNRQLSNLGHIAMVHDAAVIQACWALMQK
jgi:triacylglycerol lipase